MRAAEAAGTDSVRTRDGPDSAVDRAAMEVNVTAAVHPGPGSLPAMATTLLARTDVEGRATDDLDRHSALVELDIVAGREYTENWRVVLATMEATAEDHCRADPVDRWRTAGIVPALVDDLGVEEEDPLDQVDRLAAADPAVGPVVAVAVHPVTEEDNYRGSGREAQAGTGTDRANWHPVVEDDTAAGHPSADCRDGVVEPIPAGVHRTVAEADRVVVAAVVPVDPDPPVAAAEVGSGRSCWDSDAGDAAAVADAIGATN